MCVYFVKLALLMSCHILLHPYIRQHHPRSDGYFWNLECEIFLLGSYGFGPLDLELKTQSWLHWPNLQTEDFLAKDVRNWEHNGQSSFKWKKPWISSLLALWLLTKQANPGSVWEWTACEFQESGIPGGVLEVVCHVRSVGKKLGSELFISWIWYHICSIIQVISANL